MSWLSLAAAVAAVAALALTVFLEWDRIRARFGESRPARRLVRWLFHVMVGQIVYLASGPVVSWLTPDSSPGPEGCWIAVFAASGPLAAALVARIVSRCSWGYSLLLVPLSVAIVGLLLAFLYLAATGI